MTPHLFFGTLGCQPRKLASLALVLTNDNRDLLRSLAAAHTGSVIVVEPPRPSMAELLADAKVAMTEILSKTIHHRSTRPVAYDCCEPPPKHSQLSPAIRRALHHEYERIMGRRNREQSITPRFLRPEVIDYILTS